MTLNSHSVARIRSLADKGSIVYVMRYRSVLDYLMVLYLFLREKAPLPRFVPELPTLYLRPLSEMIRRIWDWYRAPVQHDEKGRRYLSLQACRVAVADKRPILLFMRSRVPTVGLLGGRPDALRRARRASEFLREIVISEFGSDGDVYVVPLAITRGRGHRRSGSRLGTLMYSVQEAPGEFKRFLSALWNRRNTRVRIGQALRVGDFIEEHRDEGAGRIANRLSRSLMMFLRREERVVWGPDDSSAEFCASDRIATAGDEAVGAQDR